ncbi:hypothetical protein ASPSYDRAFT_27814 [Aspergillus sydowii CBS 593.65]|uniref:Uncharacterized protein n=1 Tax=Aspergillus sydowii CBS 593.65 TaxID=1036612 RepID=A0A1L9TSA5_9EURO|nr:uncharacterized protein ASPSYDRAFT_27814 [Aspergillus sydowii CBS 593.65]OJJ62163.1 hypothetical protein ASPSYDRAFT_27814 [Aspergillus sydowii CBS 593.65]
MRSTILATVVASLAVFTSAAPAEDKRQIESVSLTFYGANGQKYSQTFSTDGESTDVDNSLVVDSVYNPGGAICSVSGVEGDVYSVPINTHKLDKPQAIKSASCHHL